MLGCLCSLATCTGTAFGFVILDKAEGQVVHVQMGREALQAGLKRKEPTAAAAAAAQAPAAKMARSHFDVLGGSCSSSDSSASEG